MWIDVDIRVVQYGKKYYTTILSLEVGGKCVFDDDFQVFTFTVSFLRALPI